MDKIDICILRQLPIKCGDKEMPIWYFNPECTRCGACQKSWDNNEDPEQILLQLKELGIKNPDDLAIEKVEGRA